MRAERKDNQNTITQRFGDPTTFQIESKTRVGMVTHKNFTAAESLAGEGLQLITSDDLPY